VRIPLFGRSVPSAYPAFQQQWPEGHAPGQDQQAKSPARADRLFINALYSLGDKNEREDHTDRAVKIQRTDQRDGSLVKHGDCQWGSLHR